MSERMREGVRGRMGCWKGIYESRAPELKAAKQG